MPDENTTRKEPTSDDIRQIVIGNTAHMRVIMNRPHRELVTLAEQLSLAQRTVKADAVKRVLEDLRNGEIPPEQAQPWASFLRYGYLPGSADPTESVHPIEFPYEASWEDAIVEAIARMEELGDLIDGTLDRDEIQSLLAQLSSK